MSDRVKNTAEYILAGVAGVLLLAIIGFVVLQRSVTKPKSNPRQPHHDRDSTPDTQKVRHRDEQTESDDRPIEDESEKWDEYKSSIIVVYFISGVPLIYESFAQSWNKLANEYISNLFQVSALIPSLDLPESYFFVYFPLLAAELSRGGIKKLHLSYNISRQKAGALSGFVVAILSVLSGFEQLKVVGTLIYTVIFAVATAYLGNKKKGLERILLYFFAFMFSTLFVVGIVVNVG